jgi:sec-independent protein translocase protein TatB
LYLFIFENIGTQELLLIGFVALIILGPRRMPEMARKIGKVLADFRNTTSEFKETWQREVNFEEEKKALDFSNIEAEPVARVDRITDLEPTEHPAEPEVREIDAASFELAAAESPEAEKTQKTSDSDDKKNWL